MLRAVIFDVDFTLARPGPELGPEGYRKVGERHGLALDPERYEDSRLAAIDSLQRHPDHVHDDELWIAFTEQIVRGMGGGDEGARACAEELVGNETRGAVARSAHRSFEHEINDGTMVHRRVARQPRAMLQQRGDGVPVATALES